MTFLFGGEPFDKPFDKLKAVNDIEQLKALSKAEVIKQSLSDYCPRVLTEKRKRPYDLIKDLLDKGGSGRSDLSERGEEILRERFRRKT